MQIARTGLAVAAALLALSGCASAEDHALPSTEDASSTSEDTDEPTEEPTDEPTDEPTEEPTEQQTKEPSTPVPEIGQCRDLNQAEIVSGTVEGGVSAIDCGKRHNAQTFYVADARGGTKKALKKGDLTKVHRKVEDTCRGQLASWTGTNRARLARTGYDFIVSGPPVQDAKLGASWVRCDVVLLEPSGYPISLPKDTRGSLSGPVSDVDLCVRGSFTRRGTQYVLCSDRHHHRSFAAVRLGSPSSGYPGEGTVRSRSSTVCTGKARARGVTFSGYTYPLAAQWKEGDVYAECYRKTKK